MNKKVLMKKDKSQSIKKDSHIQYTNTCKNKIVNTVYLKLEVFDSGWLPEQILISVEDYTGKCIHGKTQGKCFMCGDLDTNIPY